MIFGRHQQELEDALNSINQINPQEAPIGFVADLAKEEDIQKVFNEVDTQLPQLDVFVCNAALAYQSISEGNYSEWQYIVNTNLLAYMACAHEAIQRMQKNGAGHIVNIGSMSADVREQGSSVYVGTKAGIQGFTEALRKEVNESGIKVTLIEPGAVGTDMQPSSSEEQREKIEAQEMLKAEDIAMSVLYALSQPKRSDVVVIQIRPHMQII